MCFWSVPPGVGKRSSRARPSGREVAQKLASWFFITAPSSIWWRELLSQGNSSPLKAALLNKITFKPRSAHHLDDMGLKILPQKKAARSSLGKSSLRRYEKPLHHDDPPSTPSKNGVNCSAMSPAASAIPRTACCIHAENHSHQRVASYPTAAQSQKRGASTERSRSLQNTLIKLPSSSRSSFHFYENNYVS